MQMVGHRTESIYRRHHIVAESDIHDAGARLDGATTGKVVAAKLLLQENSSRPANLDLAESLRELVPGAGIEPTRPFQDPGF